MALQGSWQFNENNGTISVDTSGNGRDVTNVSGWISDGHTGPALALDGSQAGAQLNIPSEFDFFSSSTFMAWVRLNSVNSFQEIFYGPRYANGGVWYVGVNSSGHIVANWGSGLHTGGSVLQPDTWYHVSFAIDWAAGGGASVSNVYLDGILEITAEGFPINSGVFRWGGNIDALSGDLPINGCLDDARWYSERLEQAQIQSLMNTPVAGILESSGTTKFAKDQNGQWMPLRTQRTVNPPEIGLFKGWELTAQNTGIARHGINGDKLSVYKGSTKPAAFSKIIGKKITTPLDISNGNITLERCYIKPSASWVGLPIICGYDTDTGGPAAGPSTVIDCTFDGSELSQHDAAMSSAIQATGEIRGNYISGLGSGIAVMGAGTQGDAIIEGNFVTDLIGWGDPATDGNHSDGFTIRDFSAISDPQRKIEVVNNRFNCNSPNATAALFIQTYKDRIDNVRIENNLLEGGGYTLGLNELAYPYSNIRAINNRFAPTGFGATYIDNGEGYVEWVDNHYNDSSQPDNKGAIITG